MVNVTIPDWGFVLSLLAFAVMLAGAAGAVYSRIGKLEGTVTAKLNGAFTEVCKDVKELKTESVPNLRTDVMVLRTDVTLLRLDLNVMKPQINEINEHVAAIRGCK